MGSERIEHDFFHRDTPRSQSRRTITARQLNPEHTSSLLLSLIDILLRQLYIMDRVWGTYSDTPHTYLRLRKIYYRVARDIETEILAKCAGNLTLPNVVASYIFLMSPFETEDSSCEKLMATWSIWPIAAEKYDRESLSSITPSSVQQ